MIEMILHHLIDKARGLDSRELVLRLALKLRIADEEREQDDGIAKCFVAGDRRRAAVADHLAIGAQAAQQRRAHAAFMRAALRRRDRVAIGMAKRLRRLPATPRPIRPCLDYRADRPCRRKVALV